MNSYNNYTNTKAFLFSLILILSMGLSAQTYSVKALRIGKATDQVFAGDYIDGKLFFCSNAKAKKAKGVVNEDDSRFLNLYYIRLDENNDVIKKSEPVFLSDNINSELNEGPIYINKTSGDAYFSSNIKSDSSAITLGIYHSEYELSSGVFSKRSKVKLDLGDGNYSNPTISSDGSKLVFSFTKLTDTTSNLYLAEKKGNSWSKPTKIETVSSPHSETFPRWYKSTLFFASNRPGGVGGLDIYQTTYSNGKFSTPNLLPEPINSTGDDFLFFQISDQKGFLSSNRNQGRDRIYKFDLDIPTTSNFVESDINFCYTMQDENILDKSKYDYIWEFGDGNKKNGAIVDYCYKDTGIYELSCHLMDIENLEIEKNIITATIEVTAELPIISSQIKGDKIEIFLEQKWSRKNYTNYYWIVNDQIISDPTISINPSQSKPIEVKAVLWNTDESNKAVGLVKTITSDQ